MKGLIGSFVALMLLSGVAVAVPSHFSDTLPSQAPNGTFPMSNGYDWVLSSSSGTSQGFSVPSSFLLGINTLAAATTGQLILCSDCTNTALCVSSGTTPGAWVIVTASGVFTGSNFSGLPHCR